MTDDGCGKNSVVGNTGAHRGKGQISRVLKAVANQRRRYALYYLRDQNQAQTDELAAKVAGWEQEIPVSEVSPEEVEQVQATLVHNHLPMLSDYGLIEYDRRSETARYAYTPTFLDEVLKLSATFEQLV